MAKLSTAQFGRLAIIHGNEISADEENRRRAERGKFRRVPRGEVAPGDRTRFGLERRGLVDKSATAPGLNPGEFLWTVTEAGRKALNDRET
jgi:hypothetical protein